MKEDTAAFLLRAAQAIEAAESLLSAFDDFAVGRAYYAMLYTAEAILLEEGYHTQTHAAVHGLFGQHFAKTGKFDPKYHRCLIQAFRTRLEGDYSAQPNVSPERAREVTAQAREFLDAARRYLGLTANEGEQP